MRKIERSKIWLSSPHMSGRELKYVHDAFQSNWIAPLGPNIDSFEQELQAYTDADHVAALSSGTAALHLGLILLDVKEDDFVLTQSLTFAASANPIRYLGATPVFIDSERSTWNMCPVQLEIAIEACINGELTLPNGKKGGKLPKAIIPVHLYGMPANMTEIIKVANKYGIPVLEDAAEALGSAYKNQFCGTFGTMGALSFNGNKIITASGGGALLSNNEELITKAKFLATQARDNAAHYEHSEIGYNYRMSNVLAGIGRGQLEVIDNRVVARRRNFKFYDDCFKAFDGITVQHEPSGDYYSNHWLTAILIDPEKTGGIDREFIRLKLAEDNIESRPIWKPMHLQPVFENYPFFGTGVADEIFEKGLCLPSGSNLLNEDLYRVMEVFEQAFSKKNVEEFVVKDLHPVKESPFNSPLVKYQVRL